MMAENDGFVGWALVVVKEFLCLTTSRNERVKCCRTIMQHTTQTLDLFVVVSRLSMSRVLGEWWWCLRSDGR